MFYLLIILAAIATLSNADKKLRGSESDHGRRLPITVANTVEKGNFLPCGLCPAGFMCLEHNIGNLDYPHHYTCECDCDGTRRECIDECTARVAALDCPANYDVCCEDIGGVEFVFNMIGSGLIFDCLSPEAV